MAKFFLVLRQRFNFRCDRVFRLIEKIVQILNGGQLYLSAFTSFISWVSTNLKRLQG